MPNNNKKPFRYRVLSLWDKLIEMFKPTIKGYRDEDDDDNNDSDKDEQIRELYPEPNSESSADKTLYEITSERARRHEEERSQEEEKIEKTFIKGDKYQDREEYIIEPPPLPPRELENEKQEEEEFEPMYLGDEFFDSPEEYHLGDNINTERNCRDDRDDDDLEL